MKGYKLVAIFVLLSLFLVPSSVFAKSIKDYRDEIASLRAEQKEQEEKSAEIEAQIETVKAEMAEISRKVAETIKKQEKTKDEIEDLEKRIEQKEQEIKDLLSFYQVSNSENFYLKYVFGAESFEDFIYRFSVAEQLTEANDKLVDEMGDLIEENEKKIKQLEQEAKELDELDRQAAIRVEKLGSQKDKYTEFALSYDDKIALLEKQIAYYKKQGCGETEDFSVCMNKGNVPSASGFIRPTPHGVIANDGTSDYGWRWHPVWKDYRFHEGVDVIGFGTGASIIAAATGVVQHTGVWGGGGNTVIMYHNINGKSYTTMYMHLNSIDVSEGEIVNQGQRLGGAGTTGVSTGVHLHFQVIEGHRLYYNSSQLINPRNVINFPRLGVWW